MKTKKTTTGYVTMDLRRCTECWKCIKKCPKKVIGKAGFLCHRHAAFKNAAACIGCSKCIKTCPNGVFLKPNETVSIHKVNTGMSFGIERLLPIAFAASAVTGIGLHIAGHGGNHEMWHNWAIAHIATTFVWLLSVAGHVKRHILWYRTFISKGLAKKDWITFSVSMLFLSVTITGLLLIAYIGGANSDIGLLHYKLGILLSAVSLIHAICRK